MVLSPAELPSDRIGPDSIGVNAEVNTSAAPSGRIIPKTTPAVATGSLSSARRAIARPPSWMMAR